MLYPMIEFHTDCPNAYTDLEGNELCTGAKMVLWEITAALSLYHWDGISTTAIPISLEEVCCYNENVHTYAADEGNYKSVFPILTILVMFIILKKLQNRKSEGNNLYEKMNGDFDDD